MEIEVDGRAHSALPPERATLTLRLGFESDDKAQSLTATTALVAQVQAAIDQLAAQQPAPTTWSAVLPVHTRSWHPYSSEGTIQPQRHSAASVVKLTFRDFRALSAFADHWGGIDGVVIEQVDWAITEGTRRTVDEDVLTRAVTAARARAETIARAAGEQQVTFVRVADPPEGTWAPGGGSARFAMASADATEGIDLAPEDVEVRAVLRAVFTTT